MVIVREDMSNPRYGNVYVTYDNEILDVSFNRDSNSNRRGFTHVKFINGFEITDFNPNMVVKRDDRDDFSFGNRISTNTALNDDYTVFGDGGRIKEFLMNFGLGNTNEMVIDVENANLYLNGEPYDESEPEPEKTIEVIINNENVTATAIKTETEPPEIIDLPDTISQGDYTINITPDENVVLNAVYFEKPSEGWSPGNDRFNFTIEDNIATYELNQSRFDNWDDIDVTIELEIVEPEPEPEPEPETILVSVNNVNSTTTFINTDTGEMFELEFGTDVNIPVGNYDVDVIAKQGFIIVSGIIKRIGGWSSNPDINLIVSDSGTVANANIDVVNGGLGSYDTINVNVVTEQESGIPDIISTFNKLYFVGSDDLREIGRTYFVTFDEYDLRSDFAPYVINVLRLPFSLNPQLISNEIPVSIGYRTIDDIIVPEIITDRYRVDIGQISVPEIYENSYDYQNTDIILHLPYTDSIILDSAYVIGETIEIEYVISLYDGNTTINIKSSKIDDVFHSQNVKIGATVPFIRRQNQEIVGNQNIALQVFNGLKRAYIEVIRNVPYNIDSQFNEDVTIINRLINESGFISVQNIELQTKATMKERDMMKSILRNGVFING